MHACFIFHATGLKKRFLFFSFLFFSFFSSLSFRCVLKQTKASHAYYLFIYQCLDNDDDDDDGNGDDDDDDLLWR